MGRGEILVAEVGTLAQEDHIQKLEEQFHCRGRMSRIILTFSRQAGHQLW